MASSAPNFGKPRTQAEVSQLRQEANGITPTRVIGVRHGRSPAAIHAKEQEERISLKPVDQSPHGSRGSRS